MRRYILILLSLLLLATFSSPSYAFGPGRGMPSIPPDAEVHKLQKKALSLSLINHLKLTKDQRSKIKELLTPIQKDIGAIQKAENYFINTVIKNRLKKTVAKLEKGEEASPPSEEILAQHRSIRTLKRGLFDKGKEILPQIMKLLTPEQLLLFDNFDPKDIFEFGPPRHRFELLKMPPEELIRQIRDMPNEDLEEIIDHMGKRMEKRGHGGKRGQMHMLRIQAVKDLMLEIKNMPEKEFAQKVESLKERLQDLMPPKHGRFGKGKNRRDDKNMGKHFKNIIFFTDAFYEAL